LRKAKARAYDQVMWWLYVYSQDKHQDKHNKTQFSRDALKRGFNFFHSKVQNLCDPERAQPRAQCSGDALILRAATLRNSSGPGATRARRRFFARRAQMKRRRRRIRDGRGLRLMTPVCTQCSPRLPQQQLCACDSSSSARVACAHTHRRLLPLVALSYGAFGTGRWHRQTRNARAPYRLQARLNLGLTWL
jgi:hypothetical protein